MQFEPRRCPGALYRRIDIETESISQEQFSASSLLEAARRLAPCPAREFMRGLIAKVLRFSERDEFDDDVCLVGMEVKESAVAL